MNFIATGGYREAYAQATTTDNLANQVGPSAPTIAERGRAQGNDENWKKVVEAIQEQTKLLADAKAKAQPMPAARMWGP